MTAVEWFFEQIMYADVDIKVWNDILEQAKEMEKQQQEEFAIGFAEWICTNNYKKYSNGWANIFTKAMTEKELLEIYKQEQGL